jgi:hypothetical protein
MSSPQVQIGISDTLLKRVVRELVPNQLPCQNPQPDPAEEKELTYVTEIDVTEVVPLRADEKAVQDAAGTRADNALKTLGGTFNFPTATTRTVLATPAAGGQVSVPDVPELFLLVSCKLKLLSSAQLHTRGTSAATTPVGGLEFEEDLHRSPQDQAHGALLFAIDALPLASNDVGLRFRFLCLFNSGLVTSQLWVDSMRRISAQIGEHTIPLQLGALLSGLGLVSGPINVGLSAPSWTGSPPTGAAPTLALRLGLDAELTSDVGGWSSFLGPTPTWLLTSATATMGDLGVAIDGPYLKGFVEKAVAAQLRGQSLPAGMSFGPPTVTFGATLPTGVAGIEVRIPVWEQALGVGDAIASLEFSSRSTPGSGASSLQTFLDATACVRFDENLGTKVLVLLGAILTGGLLLALISPALLITGAIIGADAAINLLSAVGGKGTPVMQSLLGQANPGAGMSCEPLHQDTGCRTCSIRTDLETPLGHLALAQVALNPAGVALVWALPSLPTPTIASVDVTTGLWHCPARTCELVDPEPVKRLLVRNDGGLPLVVCSVTQYLTTGATARVLEFSPATRGLGPLALLAPGQSLSISVQAHVNDPSYDQASPPPLFVRVLTSGGYRELDLNKGVAAEAMPERDQATINRASALLCGAMSATTHQAIWHQVAFTDPIPFRITDVVHERVDVRASASDGDLLEGWDSAGRLLARAYAADAAVGLSVADSRAAASEHEHSQIAVVASSAARLVPAVAAASTGVASVSRWLYRASSRIDLRSAIVGAAPLGDRLVILTDGHLHAARALPGGFERWRTLPIREGIAVACLDGLIAVGTRSHLLLLSPDFEVLHAREGGCRALVAAGGALWSADADGVRVMTLQREQLTERSLIWMPEVGQLVTGGGAVVALSQDHLYLLSDNDARPLERTSQRLTTLAGLPAAADEQGLAVLDQMGRVVADYAGRPWGAGLIEWEHCAVETLPGSGVVMLHDRYETRPDFERLPDLVRAPPTT